MDDHATHPNGQLFAHPHLDMLVILLANMGIVGYLFKYQNKLFRHPVGDTYRCLGD